MFGQHIQLSDKSSRRIAVSGVMVSWVLCANVPSPPVTIGQLFRDLKLQSILRKRSLMHQM